METSQKTWLVDLDHLTQNASAPQPVTYLVTHSRLAVTAHSALIAVGKALKQLGLLPEDVRFLRVSQE